MSTETNHIFKQKTGLTPFQFLEYIIKCIIGVTSTFLLFLIFPQFRDQLYWVIISVMLAITHDNDSKAAVDRMKGNTVGGLVGLIGYFLDMFIKQSTQFTNHAEGAPSIILIIIGVMITISLCTAFGFVSVSRTALVAFFIVMIYEDNHHSYDGAIMRMSSTVIGCLLGLIINKTFVWLSSKVFLGWVNKSSKEKSKKDQETDVY